jgi:anti-sigma factor RsiW
MKSDCDAWQEAMSLWLDGQLQADRVRALERHLEMCPACQGVLHALRHVDTVIAAARTLAPPAGFGARVQAKLAARRQRQRVWAGFLMLALATVGLGVMAAVILILPDLDAWQGVATGDWLSPVAGMCLTLGTAGLALINLVWAVAGALASVLAHPLFLAFLLVTALLVAVWSRIVAGRAWAFRPPPIEALSL